MKILMFFPGNAEHLPPLINASVCSSRLGAETTIVASCATQATKSFLNSYDVRLLTETQSYPKTKFGRAVLRAKVGLRLIREYNTFNPDCVWFHGETSLGYALLLNMKKTVTAVAHMHEMYDDKMVPRFLMRYGAHLAHVVVCPEINRQWIIKIKTKSNALFLCVPNRPSCLLLSAAEDRSDPDLKELFCNAGGSEDCSRFIVYQGTMMPGRALPGIISAFKQIDFKNTGLIMLGGENGEAYRANLQKLSSSDNRIVFLPRLPPPRHLEITRQCVGGILLYEPTSLNNLYCAPNKIYEYASYGLDMLLPDFPGMACLNRQYHIGHLCDPLSESSIRNGLLKLLSADRAIARANAAKFLESEKDPLDLYSDIINVIQDKKAVLSNLDSGDL